MTLTPFKNRTIDPALPVEVYLNLHKKDGDGNAWYSVRQGRAVVAHTDAIALIDVTFIVNEAGRDRVRAEKRKNVHAWLLGYIPPEPIESDMWHHAAITYNPYRDDYFMIGDEPISRCSMVDLCIGGKLYT